MTTTELINKFIEENTTDAFGSVLGYIRTRDALNIALARLDATESHAEQAEKSFNDTLADLKQTMQERDDLRRQLEQAQTRIAELETRTDNAAEHLDIDRGAEWEAEYYLRGMHR